MSGGKTCTLHAFTAWAARSRARASATATSSAGLTKSPIKKNETRSPPFPNLARRATGRREMLGRWLEPCNQVAKMIEGVGGQPLLDLMHMRLTTVALGEQQLEAPHEEKCRNSRCCLPERVGSSISRVGAPLYCRCGSPGMAHDGSGEGRSAGHSRRTDGSAPDYPCSQPQQRGPEDCATENCRRA